MLMRKSQAILEYAVLAAVIVGALLIMQAFVKKGYQGSLKASADKMGEQFSAGAETIKVEQSLAQDQVINIGVLDQPDVYSWTTNKGGKVTSVTQSKSDSLKEEKTRKADYSKSVPGGGLTDPDLP